MAPPKMGASASVMGELPDPVDAETAARLLGDEFDADAFAQMAAECAAVGVADGCIPRERFLEALEEEVEEEGERVFTVVHQELAKVRGARSVSNRKPTGLSVTRAGALVRIADNSGW